MFQSVFETLLAESRDVCIHRLHMAGNNTPVHRHVAVLLWKLFLKIVRA
jgi:hypothetical protein